MGMKSKIIFQKIKWKSEKFSDNSGHWVSGRIGGMMIGYYYQDVDDELEYVPKKWIAVPIEPTNDALSRDNENSIETNSRKKAKEIIIKNFQEWFSKFVQ